jgi:hypothetical protein
MSGSKETTVTMAAREAERLRQSDVKLRAVQQELPERLRAAEASIREEVHRQNARMDQRLRKIENTASQMQSDMASLEKRNRQLLARQRDEYRSLVATERAERIQQGQQMRDEYYSLIEAERAERQQQVSELQSRVSQIEDREGRLGQMASAWLQDLRILSDDVGTLPHERFSPGSMGRINGHIEQAAINLRDGASQAALGQAQNAYFELVELRSEVLRKEQQFEAEYLRALNAIRSLIEEVRLNRQAVIPADESSSVEIEVDIDFWSREGLTPISERLANLQSRLEKEKETLELTQVQEMEQETATLRAKLPAVVEAARMTIINSQACHNVAEIVADVMEQQGYHVEEGTYEGEDQRGSYAVKMRNVGGDEFVTIIKPSKERELEYTTEMNFYDRDQDETMRQNFAQAVCDGLNQRGLHATAPQETLGVTERNEAVRNLDQFRQRRGQASDVRAKS